MGARRKSSSISTIHIVLAFALMLGSLVVLAVILAPKKPTAPAVSSIAYTEHPKDRKQGRPGPPMVNEAPRPDRGGHSTQKTSEAPPPPQEEVKPFTLAVMVVDARTGDPIEQAGVRVQRTWSQEEQDTWRQHNTESIQSRDGKMLDALHDEERKLRQQGNADSNDQGAAEIAFSLPGNYVVHVTKTGFIPLELSAHIEGESKPRTTVEAKLSTGATVAGRVTETGTSKGVPNVLVQAEPVESTAQPKAPYFTYYAKDGPRTDDNGNYELSGLPTGEFAISVSLRDAPYKAGKEIPYQKVKITQTNQEIKNIDFKLDPAGTVWGYVTSPDKEPIKGADVLLCTSQSVFSQALTSLVKQTPPLHDNSEEDGYYALVGVPLNQEWRLYVTSEKMSPQMAEPFILTAAKREVNIDVFMFSGTTLYGRVVDNERKAIEGASVVCIPSYTQLLSPMETPHAFRDARSDADGNFVIKELPAGDYQVFAQKRGYKIPTAGEPINPNGYTDLTGLEVMLYRVDEGTHAIYGTVVDVAGQVVSGAHLALEGMGMESLSSMNRDADSDSQGKFRFDGMETGMYRLKVTKEGYSPKSLSRVMLDRENRVIMDTAALVQGRVLVKSTGRAPESGYTVSAIPLSSTGSSVSLSSLTEERVSQAFNNTDGSFELRVAAGHYRIEAQASGYTAGRQEVTVEAGEVVNNVLIQLSDKGGTIAGRVTTSDGKSPQGTQVSLVEADSASDAMLLTTAGANGSQYATKVGQDGAFSFTNLPAGTYTAIAQHEGYAAASSDPLLLEAEGNLNNVELRLGTGGVLRGYVYRNGQVAVGATVMLTGPGGTKTATSDQSGAYSIEDLSGGTYQAMVTYISSAQGASLTALYDIQGVQIEIQDAQVTNYNFGEGTGVQIDGQCSRPPSSVLGGRAVLGAPGMAATQIGGQVDINHLTGNSTGINPMGTFTLEDVPQGEWQLDIYFFEGGIGSGLTATYVGTQLVNITGQEPNVSIMVSVQ